MVRPIGDYIGIPYVRGGSDIFGVDCFGLVRLFYREQYGIDIDDYGFPLNSDMRERLVFDNYEREGFHIVGSDERAVDGDILLLKFCGVVCHFGILIDGDRVLQAYEKAGCVVAIYYNRSMKSRTKAVLRYGVKDNG